MIQKIRIRNFKCLKDTGDILIKPFTFLVGPNSSGKTSFLQLLLLLKQSVESTDYDAPLEANSSLVKLGDFPEFINNGNTRSNLNFEMEFSTKFFKPLKIYKGKKLSTINLKCIYSYRKPTSEIRLKSQDILAGNFLDLRINYSIKTKKYMASLSSNNFKKVKQDYLEVKPLSFSRFYFVPNKDHKFPANLYSNYFDLYYIITRTLTEMFYVGPLREHPHRVYLSSGIRPRDVGIRGEKTIDALKIMYFSRLKRPKEIRNKIELWFKKLGFSKNINIEKLGNADVYRVMLVDPSSQYNANLADVGFGVSQTLPVIAESLMAFTNSTLLIEQPEIHLHPKAQAILADFFIDASEKRKKTFIIETHSEHLLSRIRKRIADPRSWITQNDVAIYYFEPTKKGTKIYEVKLNELGQYSSFPEGFFEEDIVEAFEHLNFIKNRQKK